jgi:trk system potassium uptake protein TrkA
LLKLLKIDELMIPEAMAAAWLARTLKTPDFLNSIELGSGYEVVQVRTPEGMVGKTLQEAAIRDRYQLNLITIAKGRGTTSSASTQHPIQKVLGVPAPGRCFEPDDILVLFGKAQDIRRMMHELVK